MSTNENGEDEITDTDRQIAESLAEHFGGEPDYESSANTRRELQSVHLYTTVHGLNMGAAWTLVKIDDHERYAIKHGIMTPVVSHAIAEARRLGWANSDDNTMLDAIMASYNAITEERMKPENMERERRLEQEDNE